MPCDDDPIVVIVPVDKVRGVEIAADAQPP
jgi:hypothetical protein